MASAFIKTGEDQAMIDFEELAPEGKKWECCAACGGKGRILVDDVGYVISRAGSVPPSTSGSDGVKRYK